MRIVVLVSGTGSNLQAVIDAVKAGDLDVEIAAVGADRPGTYGVERSAAAGIPTFVVDFKAYPDRAAWDAALTDAVSDPDRARTYGEAGRRRAQESFSWDAIAGRTLELYRSLT